MTFSIQEVVFDCCDAPSSLAQFWAGVFDARWAVMGDDWALVESTPLRIGFQRVPEAKLVKNRLHLDVQVDDVLEAAQAAVARGARIIAPLQGEPTGGFAVLAEPWGNEFCFVADGSGQWEAGQVAALEASVAQD